MRILLVLVAVSSLTLAAVPSGDRQYNTQRKYKIADKVVLERQRNIIRLFRYINQPSYYKEFAELAGSYSIETNVEAYSNPQAVKQFLYYYRHGLLPRGEIFSVFYDEHLQQAISLFKVFYYANDYEVFYKTAVWARNNVNEGIFLYALSVAIVHRADTYGIILPPIYEVYPNYFFNSEVIHKAYQYKQEYYGSQNNYGRKGYIIYSNYSGYYLNLNPEQSLSYFTEDVGINAYYYYYNIYYPFWMSGEEFKLKYDRRGEQYYYVYQQLLARYYLERLSNDFGETDLFNYDEPLPTGYYPSLQYPNGLEFPSRPNYARLHEYFYNYGQKTSFKTKYTYSYTHVTNFERRILDAIDSGYVKDRKGELVDLYTPQGFEVLANVIEGNPESANPRYYGPLQVFARHLLGYATQPLSNHQLAPSALEHFETSLRDPVFYQFYKRVVLFFQKYKANLPAYTFNELSYPGVKVEGVEFDRLVTYFDYFDSDISNAAYVAPKEYDDDFRVRARQYRLNHKPFTYRIRVSAEQAGEAVVRVYLGPKYDEYYRPIGLNENRVNFVEIDEFKYSLQAGENKIERNNRQNWYTGDRTSFEELYDRVEQAWKSGEEFQVDGTEAFYGFPLRYLLPRGKRGGQEYQVYVIVSPFQKPALQQDVENYYYPRVGTGGNYIDSLPFGYPFDRPIDEYIFYKVPNSYFQEVVIYNKDADNVNASVQTYEQNDEA